MEQTTTSWRWLLVAVLCILVVHLIAVRWQKRHANDPPRRSTIARGVRVAARPSTLFLLLGGMCLVRLVEPKDEHHVAQPSPENITGHAKAGEFQSQLARQGIMQGLEFVSRLEKTYYRGNDDRSPKLFNGGIYRTCEFRISLRTADGKVVAHDESLADRPLVLRVEIQRSKNTLESHFQDAVMTDTVLVCRPELPSLRPVVGGDAAFPFKVVKPGQVWAAEAPIGEASPGGVHHLRGTVLLCPSAGASGDALWQHAHYGVAYLLRFQEGKLERSSKLWMGALVLPLDLPDAQFYEWLDTKPLPEMPDDYRQANETEQVTTRPSE